MILTKHQEQEVLAYIMKHINRSMQKLRHWKLMMKYIKNPWWSQISTHLVVSNNPIMHNHKLVFRTRCLWMTVFWWWLTMSCPSSVSDSSMNGKRLLQVQFCGCNFCLSKLIISHIMHTLSDFHFFPQKTHMHTNTHIKIR